jgi:hypothetical protein
MKRILIRLGLSIVIALLAVDVGDNLVLRYRISTNRQPFGTVQIKRYFAIRHKDQRIEFISTDTENRTCTHSLLPQLGSNPCWYVSRNTIERIDM